MASNIKELATLKYEHEGYVFNKKGICIQNVIKISSKKKGGKITIAELNRIFDEFIKTCPPSRFTVIAGFKGSNNKRTMSTLKGIYDESLTLDDDYFNNKEKALIRSYGYDWVQIVLRPEVKEQKKDDQQKIQNGGSTKQKSALEELEELDD